MENVLSEEPACVCKGKGTEKNQVFGVVMKGDRSIQVCIEEEV